MFICQGKIFVYRHVFQFFILFKLRKLSDFYEMIYLDFRVQDLTERFEASQKGQTQIQEDLAYKENELEVIILVSRFKLAFSKKKLQVVMLTRILRVCT